MSTRPIAPAPKAKPKPKDQSGNFPVMGLAGSISRRWHRVATAFMVFLAMSLATVGLSQPASAAPLVPRANGTAIAYTAPTYYASIAGGFVSGTQLTMYCWVDNIGHRWFYVGGVGYNPYTGRGGWYAGYVQAYYVANQLTVGHC